MELIYSKNIEIYIWNFYFINKMLNQRITHSEKVQIMYILQ